MAEKFMLRTVFNMDMIAPFSASLKKNWPQFDKHGFDSFVGTSIESLSFGARNQLICDALEKFLPSDFKDAVQLLLDSLGPELGAPELTGYDGFIIMPQCLYVSRNGLHNFDLSMKAFYELTKRFSAEGDMRPFIEKYPQKSMQILHKWARDPNLHVRRLVSECTRPRLPLAAPLKDFKNDPTPVIELLEMLKDDPVLYVRRSVANNLNDISKDNPDVVTSLLKRWQVGASAERSWLIRHSLRTLLKRANPEALSLLGYGEPPRLAEISFVLDKAEVKIGDAIKMKLRFLPTAGHSQQLMIDYVVHFMKANGKLSPKTFKWQIKKTANGSAVQLEKKHSFREMTTRRHYPGRHLFQVVINGKVVAEQAMTLLPT